jgi:hypothetical protein
MESSWMSGGNGIKVLRSLKWKEFGHKTKLE